MDDRATLELGAVLLRAAADEGEPVDVIVELIDRPRIGAAQPDRVAHDGLEDGLQLERPAADDVEHLAGGRLLLDGLGQIPRELIHSVVEVRPGFRLGTLTRLPSCGLLGRPRVQAHAVTNHTPGHRG